MRLCVGTSKGIVILDPSRGSTPLMVLADPAPVWCMAQDCGDPAIIYAGANDTVTHGHGTFARSIDCGRTWSDLTATVTRDEEIWALAAAPSIPGQVFLGTSHGRLFRSDDHGRNFYEMEAFLKLPGRDRWSFPNPPHVPHVRCISFDPNDPSIMYIGVEEGGAFRTIDGGDSFQGLNSGLYDDVHNIAVDPADSRRLYATTGRGFYVSENRGSSWRHVTAGLDRSYTVPLLVAGSEHMTIFTAAAAGPPPTWRVGPRGADAVIFKSIDRGESFERIDSGYGPKRGMLMRFKQTLDDSGEFFGVSTDGSVTRNLADLVLSAPVPVSDKLPPAYDLAVIP